MLSFQKDGRAGRLWIRENNEEKQLIIAPWNPTDCHSTLVAIDLEKKNNYYVDPLSSAAEVQNSTHMKIFADYYFHILQEKLFCLNFKSPHHNALFNLTHRAVVSWFAGMPHNLYKESH